MSSAAPSLSRSAGRDVVSGYAARHVVPIKSTPAQDSPSAGLIGEDLEQLLIREDQLMRVPAARLRLEPTATEIAARRSRPAERQLRLEGVDGDRLRSMPPERAAARWYLRGESSLEELVLQLYFAPVSVADVESVAKSLWGDRGGVGALRKLAPEVIERLGRWMSRPLNENYLYAYLHSFDLRGHRPGDNDATRVAAAVGIDAEGFRVPLSAMATTAANADEWDELLRDLKERGLRRVRLFVGKNEPKLRAAIRSSFHQSSFLLPLRELDRELLNRLPLGSYISAVRIMKTLKDAKTRAESFHAVAKLVQLAQSAKQPALSLELQQWTCELLAHFEVPKNHWPQVRDLSGIKRTMSPLRERLRIIAPAGRPCEQALLSNAFFRHQWRNAWGRNEFLSMAK